MAILPKDHRYEYCRQLSLWTEHVSELLHMLEPFDQYPHCVVRRNNRGKFAVFTKGNTNTRTRYKLEVILGCTVHVLGNQLSPSRKVQKSDKST
jgi:hypothetical protein